ncbi:hypothetical protein M433DRAFT_66313 [Acidomyces richmondensis BFW]|nr:MAG: hypothetical protein FE78DRAFT_147024 [Acidomyces sp. 'richmondensis']KYG45892.1 hypothetical protein M433DRAFT_66313 [Acidomyces richmondensis BFW]
MADKYVLSVTAGPNYTQQKRIPINTEEPTRISSDKLTANTTVRIQNYRGLDAHGKPSPNKTSPYFSHPLHENDLYSLQFTFTLKEDVNGYDLVFGNDFDHPIRDKLPPGFQQAFNIVKWFIDPGLYGDVRADEPYLYGPLLSSMNVFRVGPKDDREQETVEEVRANEEIPILQEGGDGDGAEHREKQGVPPDAAARKKHFLIEQNLRNFTFEKDREYHNDFFNPYLDFNDFALKLPGSHSLRYVLKNRATDEPLLVVIFTLVPKTEVDDESAIEKDGENGDDVD